MDIQKIIKILDFSYDNLIYNKNVLCTNGKASVVALVCLHFLDICIITHIHAHACTHPHIHTCTHACTRTH